MNRGNCIATFVAGVALVFSTGAHSESFFQIEAGLGVNHYDSMNGVWNQLGTPGNHMHIDFPAYMAGMNFRLWENERFGVRAHIDYVNLGRLSATCECVADADYSLSQHRILDPSQPTAALSGAGSAQGIKLTIEPYVKWRGWHLGIEGGLFPYRPDYSVSAYWHVDGTTHTYETPHRVQWGKVIGANVQYKNFGVTLQRYWLPTRYSDQYSPAMYNAATVLMLTVNTNGLF